MPFEIVIEEPRWQEAGLEALFERAFGAVCEHLGLDAAGVEVSVLGCDDDRIAALNGAFREKSSATNVLSWPARERGAEIAGARPLPVGAEELGDIAIAYQTCAGEAAAQGKPMADHVTHLAVHGLLHLLGYDHIRDEDADLMEATEREILATLGIPNPY